MPVIVVIRSPSFIIIVKCRMLRCLVSMEYLRSMYRILIRKSRFSRRRPEDNFRGNFREIVVKFGSDRDRLIIMSLEVLKLCVLQPALDNHRNNTLIRRLFDKRNDMYSLASIFQI
jgi:hypothetical protein